MATETIQKTISNTGGEDARGVRCVLSGTDASIFAIYEDSDLTQELTGTDEFTVAGSGGSKDIWLVCDGDRAAETGSKSAVCTIESDNVADYVLNLDAEIVEVEPQLDAADFYGLSVSQVDEARLTTNIPFIGFNVKEVT